METITYRGKKIPVKIGYYALKMLKEKTGKELGEDSSFEMYETLLFYALKQGAKIAGTEFTFNEDDMVDVLDDCFVEFTEKVMAFSQSFLQIRKGATE